jgi:ATP-dependent exoDNAse (exonuclease V) beta subunit
MKTLKIYKSSAGSGKTFTLVTEYLKLVLLNPEDYKAILAITFTNKAAEEMKKRIIDALVSLAQNKDGPMKQLLQEAHPAMDIASSARKTLKNILHDYSAFSISTIDSFFQRILRALAREIHLPLNMDVQVELDDAILDVTERLFRDIGVDPDLTQWLTDLSLQKLDDDKGWNIEKDIASVARQLFREGRAEEKPMTREQIHNQYKLLLQIRKDFESTMKKLGEEMLAEFARHRLEVSEFAYGNGGVAGYFLKIANPAKPESFLFTKRILDALSDPEKWATKKSPRRTEIIELAESSFIPHLAKTHSCFEEKFIDYATAVEILRKIYLFGIVNDLQKKFSAYRNENNIILLSDTTRLLGDVIRDSDTPFIYEKTGNRYKHLLIDEFQDTSILQWKNLLPLIINTLGSGFTTLVVGDAKQSIYRWRGGNMNLLLRNIFTDLSGFNSLLQENFLTTNYRSREEIVRFNNQFFAAAPAVANESIKMNDFPALQLAYGTDVIQDSRDQDAAGGYVRIKFFESEEDEEGEKSPWKQKALDDMLQIIRDLLGNNYSYKDICILVRKNKEGNEIADHLINNGIQDIISPDSLLLSGSPKITFLISAFRFLLDNSDAIARTEVLYYYHTYIREGNEDLHGLFHDHRFAGSGKRKNAFGEALFAGLENNHFNKVLPEEFTAHLTYLGKLPVYELSEHLVRIFSLNENPDAYIQRFQDLILEYTSGADSSLEGFLHWWDSSPKVRDASVILPDNTNAIRIMTIHRSKGLQFRIVLMPFTDWKLLPKPNEILWLKTTGSRFDELGTVAVASAKRLSETSFKVEYEEELNHTVIDNLNLLYDAFTRAEEKLFISCAQGKTEELNTVSKLIARSCRSVQAGFDGDTFERGTNDAKIPAGQDGPGDALQTYLGSYPSNRWQEKLSLATRSSNLIEMLEDKRLSRINYGILVHDILASINHTDEIGRVVESKVYEGFIGTEEKEHLITEINEVLNVPEIKKFFDPSFSVLAERVIILPDGELLRPDRVLVKGEDAIVIDFKTGKQEKKHEKQVSRYAEVLRSMNYKNVGAGIIYLAERKVVML